LSLSFQSDIVHQSVYELVHSEDREELQRQLMWNSFLPAESASLPLHDALSPQHCHLLERSFTVRFRCLLDNTSGFLVRSNVLSYFLSVLKLSHSGCLLCANISIERKSYFDRSDNPARLSAKHNFYFFIIFMKHNYLFLASNCFAYRIKVDDSLL